jgi:hypothetical protein
LPGKARYVARALSFLLWCSGVLLQGRVNEEVVGTICWTWVTVPAEEATLSKATGGIAIACSGGRGDPSAVDVGVSTTPEMKQSISNEGDLVPASPSGYEHYHQSQIIAPKQYARNHILTSPLIPIFTQTPQAGLPSSHRTRRDLHFEHPFRERL